MFGTYVEDFGVLGSITEMRNWAKRSELAGAFTTIKATHALLQDYKAVIPVKMSVYSKLAGATLFKGAATTTQATNACPIFAGYRNRKFTNEMKETLKNEEAGGASIQNVQAEAASSFILQSID
ncbi:hypothetical protein V5799_012098 [Amblyomma americanum]|uniref:Uncharacterized protein n=1 Tax=Amblyomma americanum TaxID=6943 RepID=A0AAQ4EF07_AMBAM